jgi:hypothetical protein
MPQDLKPKYTTSAMTITISSVAHPDLFFVVVVGDCC